MTQTFLERYHEWNEVTGFPEKDTGYYFEIEGFMEDADRIIEALLAALHEIVDGEFDRPGAEKRIAQEALACALEKSQA